MANTPSFSPILSKSWDDVEAPKPFPTGSYLFIVKGLPRFDKSSKKQTEFYEFTLQPIQALDDVDDDALREFGGFVDKTIRTTFYLTEDALYRLKEFVEACGVSTAGRTPAQTINDLPNCQVIGVVKHTIGQNGRVYTDVSSFTNPNPSEDED